MTDNTTDIAVSDLREKVDDEPATGLSLVADLMRERAEAATEGTWGIGNDVNIVSGVERPGRGVFSCAWHVAEVTADFDREDENGGPNEASADDDAEHIVAMANPAVALALAGWLEHVAEDLRRLPDDIDPAVYAADIHCDALAVARAYLSAGIED